jgi:hypothetical protein
VLVLNRATEPVLLRTPFPRPWQERGSRAVKVLFIAWALYSNVRSDLESHNTYGDGAPLPPLYGIYEVESFRRNGEEAPPLTTDEKRWRAVAFRRGGGLLVRQMNDSTQRFRIELDAAKKTLALSPASPPGTPPGPKSVFTYSEPDPEHLVLEGTFQDAALSVRLRKKDTSTFLLVNRGFRWVNEFPYNR